jgi:hypothetical protein
MSRYIIYIMCILVFTSCRHDSVHEKYANLAMDYTKKMCPLPMDDYTILDSLVYNTSETTLNYYYSVYHLHTLLHHYRKRFRELH